MLRCVNYYKICQCNSVAQDSGLESTGLFSNFTFQKYGNRNTPPILYTPCLRNCVTNLYLICVTRRQSAYFLYAWAIYAVARLLRV